MDGKCVLLALVLVSSNNLVHSHILPSRQIDFPLESCVKAFMRHLPFLCSLGNSDLFYDNGMPLIPRELADRSWEAQKRLYQVCCNRPCTMTELLSMC